MDGITAVAFTLLGWLLGLLQPQITESIRRRRELREVLPALHVELDELRYRMALVAYYVQMRFGKIDRALLKWVQAETTRYEGQNPKDTLLKSLEALLASTDDKINALASKLSAPPDGGLGVKKYAAPLIDSRIPYFWQMQPSLQRALLEVRANLDLFNDEASTAQHYFDLTFDSSLNEETRVRVVGNLKDCYLNLASRATILTSKIDAAQTAARGGKRS